MHQVLGLHHGRTVVASIGALVFILFVLGLAHYQSYEFPGFPGQHSSSPYSLSKAKPVPGAAEAEDLLTPGDEVKLQAFFLDHIVKPSVKPTDPVYAPSGAFKWKLPKHIGWPQPLGKDLVILDMDSRPLNKTGEIFGNQTLSWDDAGTIHGPSLGILQHWLYAKIHGYKYHYIQTGTFPDRRDSWKKPVIIGRVTSKYKTSVFADSDAIFNHLDLPFEWLLNYWDIKNDTDALALATDPKAKHNQDEKGKLYANTGFIITQNIPVTYDIMKDWSECADVGGKFPNCTDYRDKSGGHPSDQGGFGNYIRYEYNESVKELPCAEANGFPEDKSECKGTFIKHLWTGKHTYIKIAIGSMIPGRFLEIFHKQMLSEKESFYLTEEQIMQQDWTG
ncbi:hypothetical protein ACHAQH_007191 [Verticillium albo-atrum]